MKTIDASSKGNQFIQDINDNFAECVAGGNGTIAVKIPLQGGELKSATGYADGYWCQPVTLTVGSNVPTFTYTDDNYNKYLHTPCYISLRGNKVKGISTPSGSTLTIFCYDDTFTLLNDGVVQSVDNIPSSASYVKMQIYNSSGYSVQLSLDVTFASRPQFVKNTFNPLTPQFHNYEVKTPKLWDTIPSDPDPTIDYSSYLHTIPTDGTVDVDNTRYHDNCFIMLPPSYDPQGVPCKFVIWFTGDGAMWFMGHSPFYGVSGGKVTQSVYEKNLKYFNNMGYAVVCLGGYTSMWSGETGATLWSQWTPRISPAYMASLRSCYDFVMRNYNLDPKPYLAGKSAGGYMVLNTVATLPFNVRAAAGFSISVSMANSLCQCGNAIQKSWNKRFGCSNWNKFKLNEGDYPSSSAYTRATKKQGASANQIADANRLIANNDIYRGFDQFTAMSDVDYDDFMDAVQAYDPFNDANPPAALTNLLAASHKNMVVPVKLWCATKDTAVPYSWHQIFVDWVKQCNGIAEMRSYTGDDGIHHTFCGDGGKTATAQTLYGGSMTGVNIGIIEAVEWFRRW